MENNAVSGFVDAEIENKGRVHFDYDLSHFAKTSGKYDHEIARLACKFVTVGYDRITDDPSAEAETGFPWTQKGLKSVLDGMGFARQEICPRCARDEETYFFACRPLTLNGTEYDFYVAAFIGSYKKSWFSNFDPLGVGRVCNDGLGYAGTEEWGAIHLGFADAREFSHGRLAAFFKKTATGRPVKLLLAGHSRGAATAALLAAKLIKNGGIGDIRIAPDDIYTYCFATPNYADTRLVNVKEKRFRRIFNVVSPEDFVTEVFPKACGFGRYGTTYAFFGADNLSRADYAREKAVMTRFFTDYRSSRPYVSYKKGNRTVIEIIGVMADSMGDLDIFYNKPFRLCFRKTTPYEYFRDTVCTFVGGNDTPEDKRNIERATKLLLLSSVDGVGTSPALRKISAFFVFKQGIAGVTGGKVGGEYFNDAHISETYLAYMMSMREDQLRRVQ
jgi:hypothetical protein